MRFNTQRLRRIRTAKRILDQAHLEAGRVARALTRQGEAHGVARHHSWVVCQPHALAWYGHYTCAIQEETHPLMAAALMKAADAAARAWNLMEEAQYWQ